MVGSVEVDEFMRNFNEEFFLIACMESTIRSSIWYIDYGASCHNGVVELGDDARYQAEGVATVSFERESRKPLNFADVLYDLKLTKNLISVSTLEDKGY